jgi:hypothetical protein
LKSTNSPESRKLRFKAKASLKRSVRISTRASPTKQESQFIRMADLNSMEFKSGQDLANDSNMIALGVIKRRPTRAERIRLKEEAEAKKDGSGKLDVDADGKEINPHVPKFIADVPWYVAEDTGGKASLRHQRHGGLGQDRHGMDVEGWYPRGQRKGPAATKYRKGACENCGAMTHTVKDCLERPRKLRAKWSHRDIQADEIIMDFDMSYEGKRVWAPHVFALISGSMEWL